MKWNHPQEELAVAYPNLFRLLWKSALPCHLDPLSPDSPYMLKKCTWQGKQVNCSEIFTPVITDTGVCCAFNQRSNLKDSMYSRLVRDMQGKKEEDKNEISTALSGISRGLQVTLDQNTDRWNFVLFKEIYASHTQGKQRIYLHALLWIPHIPRPTV